MCGDGCYTWGYPCASSSPQSMRSRQPPSRLVVTGPCSNENQRCWSQRVSRVVQHGRIRQGVLEARAEDQREVAGGQNPVRRCAARLLHRLRRPAGETARLTLRRQSSPQLVLKKSGLNILCGAVCGARSAPDPVPSSGARCIWSALLSYRVSKRNVLSRPPCLQWRPRHETLEERLAAGLKPQPEVGLGEVRNDLFHQVGTLVAIIVVDHPNA
jgi:hypothetical protein